MAWTAAVATVHDTFSSPSLVSAQEVVSFGLTSFGTKQFEFRIVYLEEGCYVQFPDLRTH
jgi:hypothetical protein